MLVDIRVPEIGEGVTHATVVQWRKAAGDPVAKGELIVEIMTDKVSFEMDSPATGVLREVLHGADDEVKVGTVIGRIES
jgi:pyruvate/2-oxoglutarate dehydrogenase complex dihydrolipoamide acyltransferase (E2) component